MKINTQTKTIISDLHTPVSVFLKVRQQYNQVLLLESSNYSSKENSLSFICFEPLAGVILEENRAMSYSADTVSQHNINKLNIAKWIEEFMSSIKFDQNEIGEKFNGLFGFSSFESIEHFEDVAFDKLKERDEIPVIRYDFYRYLLVFDHYYQKLHIIENIPADEYSTMESLIQILDGKNDQAFKFQTKAEKQSKITDKEFMDMVTKCKKHCQKGNVFQIVPSRRYSTEFKGDEFNVYRALRSINPSPYLYFFDYGDFKIFGSSPEAQLIVNNGEAEIHPIAGTFKRTGNFDEDMEMAKKLQEDPKENSEHVMLVDLARNDLSKSLREVKVKEYKSIQFFSHVIHLVSILTAKVKENTHPYKIFADTFPAGTLSGAPKVKALQIIDELEKHHRSYYGGGLGIIFFNGNLNHAIMIRSFLSQNNILHYQAGAGIVIDSVEENELNEVNHKLAALNKALEIATEI